MDALRRERAVDIREAPPLLDFMVWEEEGEVRMTQRKTKRGTKKRGKERVRRRWLYRMVCRLRWAIWRCGSEDMHPPAPLRLAPLKRFRIKKGKLKDAVLSVDAANVEVDIDLPSGADGATQMKENVLESQLHHVLGGGGELCDVGIIHFRADAFLLFLGEGFVLDAVGTEPFLIGNEGGYL